MEVLGVDDFDLLFITEPPEVAGHRPEETGAPEHKKGRTSTKTTELVLTLAC